eukprot:GGOE01006856.1.p1 GENE.GGOE01006856.1~~GGOE01006856.1.p1  ORF type:complete len:249 (+),score=21.25 GGOE01006856.1:83-829(+)
MEFVDEGCISVPKDVYQCKVSSQRREGVRHLVQQGIINTEFLQEYFCKVKEVFNPQTVNYDSATYNATRWSISCFMEYEKGVAKNKITLSKELLELSRPLLEVCDNIYMDWSKLHRNLPSDTKFERSQSFITRYRAVGLQTHLPKHIDGGDVDGSFILQLPTDEPFAGGGLTIWDGPDPNESTQYSYELDVGGVCFLDGQLWHQSNPVTSGERWVLVIFYRRCRGTFTPKSLLIGEKESQENLGSASY